MSSGRSSRFRRLRLALALTLAAGSIATQAPTATAQQAAPEPRGDTELWFVPGRPSSPFFTVDDGHLPPIYRGWVPVVGDWNADGIDDVFWFYPYSSQLRYGEALFFGAVWLYDVFGNFRVANELGRVGSGYWMNEPFVGDFNGDGADDILWYAPGTAIGDELWLRQLDADPSASPWEQIPITVPDAFSGGGFEPAVGDFNGDGIDDVFFYAADATTVGPDQRFRYEPRPDYVWYGQGGPRFFPVAADVVDTYVTGWDADPGVGGDAAGKVTTRPYGASFQPVVGDYDADGVDDILWLCADTDARRAALRAHAGWTTKEPAACGADVVVPSPGASYLWRGRSSGGFTLAGAQQLGSAAYGLSGDFDGDLFDDLALFPPDAPGSRLRLHLGPTLRRAPAEQILQRPLPPLRPVVGDFGVWGASDLLFFD